MSSAYPNEPYEPYDPYEQYGPNPGPAAYGMPQQGPYPQSSMYAVPYGAPRPHPNGVVVLILGILSVVMLPLLGPFAWILGNKALQEIDQNPGVYSDRGTVVAGRIMGIVGTAFLALGVLIAFLYILIVGAMIAYIASF